MHRVTKKELEKKIDYINFKLGIDTGLKGSYILYKDLGGYELHLIVNDGRGVRQIGYYKKTAREMYFFLDGIITGIQARENLADAVQA
jgi:hypothetical protein